VAKSASNLTDGNLLYAVPAYVDSVTEISTKFASTNQFSF